ncbi:hypothetical protein AB205_0146920, partial [Aquarana catesbeiana]
MLNGSGPVQIRDSPLLLQQIDALRLSMKHLKQENNKLKAQRMKEELSSLPLLHVPKLTLPKDRQREEIMSGTLYRKTSQLLDTLHQMSANAKVVDITHKKGGTPSAQLFEQAARLKSLSETIDKLK